MLEPIKRWLVRKGIGHPFPAVAQWAAARRLDVKAKREGDGLIVESRAVGDVWRLEWGASQRQYIDGFELRLRGAVGEGDPAHLLLMSRRLMQSLDAELFKQYTDDLQTRIDEATPDEMRWLVLYPKLSAAELGSLRDAFGGVGHPRDAAAQWLRGADGGALAAALARAASSWLGPEGPFVLMVQRGRLTLRMPLARPDVATFESAVELFRVARREAELTISQHTASGHPSTQPSLWSQPQPQPSTVQPPAS